jgi:molybdate transport system regulatory protein
MRPVPGDTTTAPAAPRKLSGRWELDTGAVGAPLLGETRVRLLELIHRHGSITQAARHLPLSYKAAWDAVEAMNTLAERPVVQRSAGGRAGGGTRLTDYGRRMLALYRALQAEQQAALDRVADRLVHEPGGADVATVQRLLRRLAWRSSARNQFAGRVCALRTGEVDVEVTLQLDDHPTELVALVTRTSAEQLALALGREVTALIKASSLLLLTDPALRLGRHNRLWGTVQGIVDGPVNAEVTIDLGGGGRNATAVVARDTVGALGLAPGVRAAAAFKFSSVILMVAG